MYASVGEVDVESRPTYETAGGRTVYGGGGITPDLVVQPDLLTEEEIAFRSEVLRFGSKYYDLLYGFAIQYTHEHPNLEPDFPVTDRMLDDFYAELASNGIEVDRGLYDAAGRWVGQNLASEIIIAKWNRGKAQQRWNAQDAQVQTAAQLLREATDPLSLFAVASRYSAEAGESASREKSAAVIGSPRP